MIKTCLAIGVGKAVSGIVSGLRLGDGTSLPGKIARQLDPQLLGNLGRQIQREVIAVSGTNGKTTTCGLLVECLEKNGQSLVHNQLGANMISGITAALLKQSALFGGITADYGVLEVDEASLKSVASELPVHRVVVTNLFRDQLDRYGELDTTARLIREGIDAIADATLQPAKHLILNADDPLVARIPYMGSGETTLGSVRYFGVGRIEYQYALPQQPPSVLFANEATACPACGSDLHYTLSIYGQLGHYHCPACGMARPACMVEATRVVVGTESSQVEIQIKTHSGAEQWHIHLPLPGLFNVYNLLAALAVMVSLEQPLSQVQEALSEYQGVFGRAEKKRIAGKSALVMLIKNPVGASEVIKLVAGDPNGRLWIALNDNYADGRDVSWIWDAQFELIAAYGHPYPIVVSGSRAEDMAIRLKYAGIPASQIEVQSDLHASVLYAAEKTESHQTLYLMPTYTALLALRQSL